MQNINKIQRNGQLRVTYWVAVLISL